MTDRFNRALQLAIEAHAGQVRKGTENAAGLALPYITHPLAVAALAAGLSEWPGNFTVVS